MASKIRKKTLATLGTGRALYLSENLDDSLANALNQPGKRMNEHERQIKFLCAFEFEHVGASAAAAATARINGTSFSDNFSALSNSLSLSTEKW